jgi:hypothetical protein
VPAVVGSWPQPFLDAAAKDDPVEVECYGQRAACADAVERLEAAEAPAELTGPLPVQRGEAGAEQTGPRVVVGPLSEISDDPAATLIERGPAVSGVFAGPQRGGELTLLDERGRPAASVGDGAGLIAAVRLGELPPTWLVTGADPAGVRRAVGALSESALRDRYALALPAAGDPVPLPVP